MPASASLFKACVGIAVDVIAFFMALLSFSWNQHPEPTGSRRATPLLHFQQLPGHPLNTNRAPVAAFANRLLAAEALVLIYPVWNEGFPAILKGFFDRVFIPGVSFTIGSGGVATPNLQKLEKLAA
ncbi:MAG TPA: NAD(P)H-dependent oxidoreductase, partial [Methyloceanibacter sp.]